MKRGRKPFVAKDHIIQFNQLRINLGNQSITENQFRNELKDCGIPCNKNFWAVLKCSEILEEKDNCFSFKNPDNPIHWTILEGIYAIYVSKQKAYRQVYEGHIKVKEKEIQEAVKLLKEHNFEIYAPIGTHYIKM